MTRTTDDLEDKGIWKPFGEAIPKPKPRPPEHKEVAPGIFERPDKRLYTDLPLPKAKP